MVAIEYEFLIRMALHCGRNYTKGADADIYRRMEDDFKRISSTNWNKSLIEREIDYERSAAKVIGHISDAINQAIKEITYQDDPIEDITILENLRANINGDNSKDLIDNTISSANEILKRRNFRMA